MKIKHGNTTGAELYKLVSNDPLNKFYDGKFSIRVAKLKTTGGS